MRIADIRQQARTEDADHQEAEDKLESLDRRLARTADTIADTLAKRAAIMERQERIQRRKGSGGHAASGA